MYVCLLRLEEAAGVEHVGLRMAQKKLQNVLYTKHIDVCYQDVTHALVGGDGAASHWVGVQLWWW